MHWKFLREDDDKSEISNRKTKMTGSGFLPVFFSDIVTNNILKLPAKKQSPRVTHKGSLSKQQQT